MPKKRTHIVWCPKCRKYRKMRIEYKFSKVADAVICVCGYKTKWVVHGG